MTRAAEMLDTTPAHVDLDRDALAECIAACVECAQACTACAGACLSEADVAAMVRRIRLDLDCADVCTATSRVLSRRTAYDAAVTRAVLEACATACRSCGDECSTHGGAGMEHCRVCAGACRRCERACRALLDAAS